MIVQNYLTQQQRLAEILTNEFEYGLSMLRGQKLTFWQKLCSIFNSQKPIVKLMDSYAQQNNYVRALGLFLAVENEAQRLNKFNTQIVKQANNAFKKIKDKLNRKQKILFQQKRIDIFEKFQQTQKQLAAQKRILIQLKVEFKQCYSKRISSKVNAAYLAIRKLSPSEQQADIQKEWLSFLNQQDQPNFTAFSSNRVFRKVVERILEQNYQEAWKQLLCKDKSLNQYDYFIKILTFIELRSFKELTLQAQQNEQWYQILTKHIKRLRRRYMDELGQIKVKDHLRCLQFYQSNKLFFSAEMALKGLISLLNLGCSYPDSQGQTQQQKLQNILTLYEKLLSIKSQYGKKDAEYTEDMNRIFFFYLKKYMQRKQLDYKHLLKIQQEHIQDPVGEVLFYILLKDYQKAILLAENCHFMGIMVEQSKDALEIARLASQKKFSKIKAEQKSYSCTYQDWKIVLIEEIKKMKEQYEIFNGHLFS